MLIEGFGITYYIYIAIGSHFNRDLKPEEHLVSHLKF